MHYMTDFTTSTVVLMHMPGKGMPYTVYVKSYSVQQPNVLNTKTDVNTNEIYQFTPLCPISALHLLPHAHIALFVLSMATALQWRLQNACKTSLHRAF